MSSGLGLNNKLKCNLHNEPFTLYCDRCLEPTCQKCTFLGPHHTSIHSLLPLHQAYERKVQELNSRIVSIGSTRDQALSKISSLGYEIEATKYQTEQINTEANLNRSEIGQKLQKSYDSILSILCTSQEEIESELNNINDLCFSFQQLNNNISSLVNFEKTISGLREIIDKVEIMLAKEIKLPELPRELSELRIKLKEIEVYEDLFNCKVSVIKQILNTLGRELGNIKEKKINYEEMLNQIDELLLRYDEKFGEFSKNLDKPNLRKVCLVCHFCGIFMHDDILNTACTNNKLDLQLTNVDSYYSSYNKVNQGNTAGYCKKEPEVANFATHRHYFGEPSNQNLFFKCSYLNNIVVDEEEEECGNFLLSEEELKIREVNKKIDHQNNSFINYLDLLFLKILTLAKIKDEDVFDKLEDEKVDEDEVSGYCELISMQYILVEVLGFKESEAQVILEITDFSVSEEVSQFAEKNKKTLRNYEWLLKKLKKFEI